jgi:hypothetical protein
MGSVGTKNVTTYIETMTAGSCLSGRDWLRSADGGRDRSGLLLGNLSVAPSDFAPVAAPDFYTFQSLVSDGNLYDELIRLCAVEGISLVGDPRESVKKALLRDVIAKRGSYPCAFEDMFRRAFPTVHSFVRFVNRDDHKTLVRVLQRLESWLVVEIVAPLLVDKIPILTLHDAIYSRKRDVDLVQDVFIDTCHRLGFRLAIKAA